MISLQVLCIIVGYDTGASFEVLHTSSEADSDIILRPAFVPVGLDRLL